MDETNETNETNKARAELMAHLARLDAAPRERVLIAANGDEVGIVLAAQGEVITRDIADVGRAPADLGFDPPAHWPCLWVCEFVASEVDRLATPEPQDERWRFPTALELALYMHDEKALVAYWEAGAVRAPAAPDAGDEHTRLDDWKAIDLTGLVVGTLLEALPPLQRACTAAELEAVYGVVCGAIKSAALRGWKTSAPEVERASSPAVVVQPVSEEPPPSAGSFLEHAAELAGYKGRPHDWARDVLDREAQFLMYGRPAIASTSPEEQARRLLLLRRHVITKHIEAGIAGGLDPKAAADYATELVKAAEEGRAEPEAPAIVVASASDLKKLKRGRA